MKAKGLDARHTRRPFCAPLPALVATVGLVALAPLGACSTNQAQCSSPSSGKFTVALTYAQTIPVDIYCEAGVGAGSTDAASCATQPHPFDGVTWSVTVSGSSATVSSQGGGTSWSCQATSPQSSPSTGPDGGSVAGTGCYLLVTCGEQSTPDAGPADVQIQIFPTSSTDAVALVHDTSSDCCTDEYTGTWH
jgi:hypothetical protein